MKSWSLLFLLSCYHRLRRFLGRQAWDCPTCGGIGGSYLDIRGCDTCTRLCCDQCLVYGEASTWCVECAAEAYDQVPIHVPEEI